MDLSQGRRRCLFVGVDKSSIPRWLTLHGGLRVIERRSQALHVVFARGDGMCPCQHTRRDCKSPAYSNLRRHKQGD